MTRALIGFTGYVGSTLLKSVEFSDLYNSKNISEIKGMEFDTLICAGAPAVKWKANQNPVEDLDNLKNLMNNIEEVKCNKFILISTVDVYARPIEVDESTFINPEEVSPYGRHRYYLEQFVSENFPNHLIVRLPGLFGEGLKKNFIYDMINDNCLHLQHKDSQFQFYDLANLWKDISATMEHGIKLINFAPEPVVASEIAKQCFDVEFHNTTVNPPAYYDMRSQYSYLFNTDGNYMYEKEQVYKQIREFISNVK